MILAELRELVNDTTLDPNLIILVPGIDVVGNDIIQRVYGIEINEFQIDDYSIKGLLIW